ncbi:hypothetical protein F4779DRAFT_578325 [Xylariaceae sp. FL0662B]|nr:hypothetical protein F4779DRAFT_578325 [Xylariaceae sp. FL0662B]
MRVRASAIPVASTSLPTATEANVSRSKAVGPEALYLNGSLRHYPLSTNIARILVLCIQQVVLITVWWNPDHPVSPAKVPPHPLSKLHTYMGRYVYEQADAMFCANQLYCVLVLTWPSLAASSQAGFEASSTVAVTNTRRPPIIVVEFSCLHRQTTRRTARIPSKQEVELVA